MGRLLPFSLLSETVVAKIRFTASFIRSAQCPGPQRKVVYFDEKIPGLLLEVRRSGGKTFYQRYRNAEGIERQIKIGAANILSVQEARHKGKEVLAAALLDNVTWQQRGYNQPSLRYRQFLADQYLPFAKANKRSWGTDETLIRLHIAPALGHCFLDEINPLFISNLLTSLRQRGYGTGTTNRVLILIRYSLNLARDWGLAKLTVNPTARLRTAPDVQRERFLSDHEKDRLLESIEQDENRSAAQAIKLLLLTGARRNEVTYARWEYVDWTSKTLLVPVSKTGKPRHIFLNSPALDLLRALPRDESPYLFPSAVTKRPSPSLHFPWTRIRKRAQLESLRLHDLRHSFASFAVDQGVEIYTLQKLLGHSHAKATQRYAHLTDRKLSDAARAVGARIMIMPKPSY